MKDFFKYLTAGNEDREWGLYLNVAGKSQIAAGSSYPAAEHPTGYYFNWDTGRSLNEYQINYITEGAGIYEDESGKYVIKPGTLMITDKETWHRYRPAIKKGWTENYIGFNGELADYYMEKFREQFPQPVIPLGIHEELIESYYKIFNLTHREDPGFQQICSGLIVQLLANIIAQQKQKNFSGKPIEKIIQKARVCIRENIDREINLQEWAQKNHMGYSHFRKMFKKYTGMAPHQYHLELRLMRAKELILTSDKSIKEISFELGFQTIHYFSRLFKQKTGINPSELRNNK